MSGYGWKAHIAYDPSIAADRLTLYRRRSDDTTDVVVTLDGGTHGATITTVGRGEPFPHEGMPLPSGALEAIVAVVKPGPSEAELSRLEDALSIERARVDRLLDAVAPRSILGFAHAAPDVDS